MAFITQESIDEVSNKTDIVQLIGEYVQLEQRGNDYWACCPFHSEKTPSFSVSPNKKFYHCFSCKASGTVFNFLMEMDKISYPEAIEVLAKKAGVALKYKNASTGIKSDENAKLKEELITLYTRVATSFHYFLMETEAGKFAYDYITKRGLTVETLEKFKIGYSPADGKWLRQFLLKKNYSPEFLDKSGLFAKKNTVYSFFHDRLMFPIFNRNGQVVAFGGRELHPDGHSGKYMNSSDLPHYKKGSILYAFNFAKEAIRKLKQVIICEGYMDCIAYHQCNINHAVATLGTALTVEQIILLKPFVKEILLSFDSDGAGQEATKRSIIDCRKMNIPVKVIQIQGGKDPAEIMINFGADYLTNEVNHAIFDSDFLLTKLQKLYSKDSPEEKGRACLEYFEYIDALQLETEKDACLVKFCQAFEVDKEAVKQDYLNRDKLSAKFRNVNQKQEKPAEKEIKMNAELQAVMTAVTENSSLFQKMHEEITVNDLEDDYSKQLFIIMEDCQSNNCFSETNVLNRVTDSKFRELIIKFISEPKGNEEVAVSESIMYLKKNALLRKKLLLKEKIAAAERSSLPEDKIALIELTKQKMDIDFQIEKMKG